MRITRLHLLLGAAAVVSLAAGLLARYEWPGAFSSAAVPPTTQASQPVPASDSAAQAAGPAVGNSETAGATPSLDRGFTLPEGSKAIPYTVKRGDSVPVL